MDLVLEGSLMGGRRRPKAGVPRLLDRLDSWRGWHFRRAFAALSAAVGPLETELVRMEVARAALAWVNLLVASRAQEAARRARDRGRGRRPGSRELERLARRQALADGSYAQALDRLRELVASTHRKPTSGVELLAMHRRQGPTS